MNNSSIHQQPTPTNKATMITLSCLNHVKRVLDPESGKFVRPPAPPIYAVIDLTVDRSGSMASMGRAVSNGVAEFIKAQRDQGRKSGTKTYFSLTSFDDDAETFHDNIDLAASLPSDWTKDKLDEMLFPRGLTRLIDTMMERVLALQWKIRDIVHNLPRKLRMLKPKIVGVFAVFTDGQDNSSTQWTQHNLNQVIRKTKAKGITCLFLGANQDAISEAAKYGIPAAQAVTFGPTYRSAQAAIRSATQATQRAVTGGADIGFTPLERLNSAPINATMPQMTAGGGRHRLRHYAHLAAAATPFRQIGLPQPLLSSAVPPIPKLTRQTTVSAYNFKF